MHNQLEGKCGRLLLALSRRFVRGLVDEFGEWARSTYSKQKTVRSRDEIAETRTQTRTR